MDILETSFIKEIMKTKIDGTNKKERGKSEMMGKKLVKGSPSHQSLILHHLQHLNSNLAAPPTIK
jgi:hypothetical protein